MLRGTLIPDVQSLAMGNDGGPDILAGQSSAHLPRFIEHRDGAIGLDLPNEVDASGGNGQCIGQACDLSRGQPTLGLGTLCLRGCQAPQHRRCIVRHIPLYKRRTCAAYTCERGEVLPFPEGMCPQAIQLFDLAIVLGFGDRQENESDTDKQAQPNESPEDAWGLVSSTKGGIVVEL